MRSPTCILLLTVVLAVVTASCQSGEDSAETRPARPSRTSGPGNVLLITLDTTRADRLGCYGYPQALTPTMDRLSETGVRFERAFCTVPLTLPSHASLLTGTYPAVHGLRVNSAGSLGSEVGNLAEAFSNQGFRTGAFVSAWVLNSTFGLHRGFDFYDDDLETEHEGGIPVEQTADRTCDSALAWLDQDPEEPFFAWVHFFDPHHPYEPPEPFSGQVDDLYDGEIAFVDSQIRRILDWLDSRGQLEQTLVIVAGDHGESRGEHGEPQHGFFVYDTTMRVPLIFSYPAGLPEGRVVSAEVSLVDVFPSVLDLMHWEKPSDIDGQSLVPAWTTDDFSRGPVVGESEYARVAFGWASLSMLITEQWKYIESPKAELYDHVSDPDEQNNLLDQHPDVASRLREQLFELLDAMVLRDVDAVPMDAETLARLESLGYVGGSVDTGDSNVDRRDPKEMISVYRAYHTATMLMGKDKLAEALAVLEPAARQSPQSDEIQGALGQVYLRLARWKEAEVAFRASLRTTPDKPLLQYGLAEALRHQGKTAEAIDYYSKVVVAMPDLGEAHRSLGVIHATEGDYRKAQEHLSKYAELNPGSVNAQLNLGNVLVKLQRYDDAVEAFRAALQNEPGNSIANQALWRALMAAGRHGEAIPALRAAHESAPGDDQPVCTLAWLLVNNKGLDSDGGTEVRKLADRCVELNPNNPLGHSVQGMIYARAGDFDKAAAAAQRALDLANSQGIRGLSQQITIQLNAYRANMR